ncbi:rhamnulose-1-phosphate aldolase [Collinsella sp. AGMB00827]|uniref:Rhamnulose-1-phosphate aldolase n=1 Tax=Collinsella ureilytica TaxID=2869515 RepID=A0ABS7MLJ5_9ACTN|nr:rhamnulose-1-phosphate aldolase [Collinsella urealyticum]MBY4798240.1 rhamnulose-1-phosphate aldolase [Collinsella urealyticum]
MAWCMRSLYGQKTGEVVGERMSASEQIDRKIEESKLLKKAVFSCHYFWQAGWGEFHAGNLSYLLSAEEMNQLSGFFRADPVHVPATFDTCGLEGRAFLLTRSGGQFRTLPERVEQDMGIIRVQDGAYEILWGFENGTGRPTSELPAHLLCHASRLATNSQNRIVMHCHPTYLNAMSTIADLDEHAFTKTLWSLNSECVLVFPDGIGVMPWMVCGEGPIGPATAKKMSRYRVVVWPYHGIFAAGSSFDEVIGLIETIEKNARVYVSVGGKPKQAITSEQIAELAAHFGLDADIS